MKKVVHYDRSKGVMAHPSGGVLLWPIDHPDSDRVSNDSYVLTSPITQLTATDIDKGEFETQNTRYVPHEGP